MRQISFLGVLGLAACVHGGGLVTTRMPDVQVAMAPSGPEATAGELPPEVASYAVGLPTPDVSEYTSYAASLLLYGTPGARYDYAVVCDGGSLFGSITVPEPPAQPPPPAYQPPPPPATTTVQGGAVVNVPGGQVGVGVGVQVETAPPPPPQPAPMPVAVTPFVEQDLGAVQPSTANSCKIAVWAQHGEPSAMPVTVRWSQRFDEGEASADARQEHARVQMQAGLELRATLRGRLVAQGADPDLRARLAWQKQQEDARIKAEYELRIETERAERARQEQARYQAAIDLRARYKARWVGMGCDPYHWQRQRAQAQAEAEAHAQYEARLRQEREARAQAEYEARLRIEREARAQAEAEARARYALALRVRGQVKLRLQASGAVPRPPCPEPQAETPPPAPVVGAAWVTGHWMWSGGAWVWIGGRWELPPVAGQVWVPPVRVVIDGGAVLKPGAWVEVRVH